MSLIHPDVIAMARDGEPERYLAATLSPEPVRADLVALAAFLADLRRIPDVVKEPMMGEVRLQWWRDCIDGFATNASTGHPIADALSTAVRGHNLPVLSLIAMTEARAFDLYDDPLSDQVAFAAYLTKTEAIPFALAQKILGVGESPILSDPVLCDPVLSDPVLSDLGARTFGHARLLANLPLALAKGRLPLPLDLLKTHTIDPGALLAGRVVPGVRDLIEQACRDIETGLAALSRRLRAAHRGDRLALLPTATVPTYLKAILAPGRDPLRMPAEISPLSRVMRLGRARWFGL